MWRYCRIVEKTIFYAPPPNNKRITTTEGNDEFCKLRSLFGRKYSVTDGVKACYMAEQLGFIKLTVRPSGSTVGISAQGLKFTSVSGLLNELSGAISNLPQLLTIIVSIAAIVVSVLALQHSK